MTSTTLPVIPLHLQIPVNEVKKDALIGNGSYGQVFRGRWQDIDVAIKVTPKEGLQSAFIREMEIMQQAAHPRIVRLFGVYADPHNYNLVMEYGGSSLHSVLDNKNKPLWPSRMRMAIDIGRGLKFLHERNIIHRDLKSPNILVDNIFHAKICDFGQSKVINPLLQATPTFTPTGTAKWKAPEHVLDNTRTKESDIFSYGVVLWEIATCKEPYEGLNYDQTIARISRNDFEPLQNDEKRPVGYDLVVDSTRNAVPEDRKSLSDVIKLLITINSNFKKCWRISKNLKPDSLDGKSFEKIKLSADSNEYGFVKSLYDKNPDPGFEIDSISIVYNPAVRRAFKSTLELLQRRSSNAAFKPKESKKNEVLRQEIVTLFEAMTKDHRDENYPDVRFFAGWHGVKDPLQLDNIFASSLASFGSTDEGFFGKGIYLTGEAEYAHRVYGKRNKNLILAWASCYSAFPVRRQDQDELTGKNHYGNYDAHFIPVVARAKGDDSNYDACSKKENYDANKTPKLQHTYTEFVVFDKTQCLPSFHVTLKEKADFIKEGDNLYILGDYAAAIAAYKKALSVAYNATDPTKGDLYGKLGSCYEKSDATINEALDAYKQALEWYKKSKPNDNLSLVLNRLSELSYMNGKELSLADFEWLLSKPNKKYLKEVKHLVLKSSAFGFKVTDSHLELIAENINDLSVLVIEFSGNLNGSKLPIKGLESLVRNLTKLTRLEIRKCPDNGRKVIEVLAPHLSQLHSLNLLGVSIGKNDVSLIANHMTDLKRLRLNGSNLHLPAAEPQTFFSSDYSKLKGLEFFQLIEVKKFNLILLILKGMQSLRELEIQTDVINENRIDEFVELVAEMKSLQKLDLRKCNLSKENVLKIRQKFKGTSIKLFV